MHLSKLIHVKSRLFYLANLLLKLSLILLLRISQILKTIKCTLETVKI
jgi:hypothetical protein